MQRHHFALPPLCADALCMCVLCCVWRAGLFISADETIAMSHELMQSVLRFIRNNVRTSEESWLPAKHQSKIACRICTYVPPLVFVPVNYLTLWCCVAVPALSNVSSSSASPRLIV